MDSQEPKIYLLPNLMTAGNLFCGFAALLNIMRARLLYVTGEPDTNSYHLALAFMLGACLFDLLDGRVARLGGYETPFGQEFDSLADAISFGLAPALLVYQLVLKDFHRIGWLISFIYLLCGILRLARFNCLSNNNASLKKGVPQEESPYGSFLTNDISSKPQADDLSKESLPLPAQHSPQNQEDDFIGFPIPAAAGVIASLTLFMLSLENGIKTIGIWKFALPPLLIFLSFMMFSNVRYPSFKSLTWRSKRSLPRFLLIMILLFFAIINYEWMPAVIFVGFLIYGFIRPFLSPPLRQEIEEEEDNKDKVI
jgi:CDP-diacylglycerol---serine O-phosphatidyltransferase